MIINNFIDAIIFKIFIGIIFNLIIIKIIFSLNIIFTIIGDLITSPIIFYRYCCYCLHISDHTE